MIVDEKVLSILSITTMTGTMIIYMVSCILGIMFIKKAEWTKYSKIKVFMAVCEGLISVAYIFALYKILVGDPWLNDVYAIVVIRPLVFLLGISLAMAAFTRYVTLIYGGEIWTLRKP